MKDVIQKLNADIIVSMKAKNKERLLVLRMLNASIKQVIIDNRVDSISNDEVLSIIKKMIKQRQDSISQYLNASRQDLVDVEVREVSVLEEFLPEQLTLEDLEKKVDEVLSTFAEKPTMKQMGMVMAKLADLKSVASMGTLSSIVKQRLM